MQLTHHCVLCDHQKVNLKEGSICGLTERKPNFHRTCLQISLTQKFEEKLKSVNIEYQRVLNNKWWTYVYSIVFILISFLVFFILYKFNDRLDILLENSNSARAQGLLIVVYIVLATIGIILFGMAAGAFNKYRNDVAKVTIQKLRIDEVLSVYNISYTIDIAFGKKYHGTQEVAVDLNLKGINL